MAEPTGHGLLIIERILRDREGIWRQINESRGLGRISTQMLVSSTLSLALYGAVLGASNGNPLQILASTVKLPVLFLATLAICLPTLYLFNLVFGAKLSVMQAVALIFVSITVTSVLTLAFAPISLFFLITAHSYTFFKLLNIAILVLTAIVGLRFLTVGMRNLNEHQLRLAAAERSATAGAAAAAVPPPATDPARTLAPATVGAAAATETNGEATPERVTALVATPPVPPGGNGWPGGPPPHLRAAPPHGHLPTGRVPAPGAAQLPPGERPASMALLYIWIGLFGFVGTQLAWTFRPIFGSPGEKFEVFRKLDGTFYGDLFDTIGRLLGG